MLEILAGAGVIAMVAIFATMSLVVQFAYIIVPVGAAIWLLALIPTSAWTRLRDSFRTPISIPVRSQQSAR